MGSMKALTTILFLLSASTAHAAPYEVDGELDVTRCEYYVDALGVGEIQTPEHPARFLDIYLRANEKELVDLQGETILALGGVVKARSFTAILDKSGKPQLEILDFVDRVFATRVAPGSWQLRYTFEERGANQVWMKEALGLAFFMDVQRSNGRIHRLWIKNKNDFFALDALFAADPGTETSIGIGRIRFPANDAAVYKQKALCGGGH